MATIRLQWFSAFTNNLPTKTINRTTENRAARIKVVLPKGTATKTTSPQREKQILNVMNAKKRGGQFITTTAIKNEKNRIKMITFTEQTFELLALAREN